jgi:uncharacterized protein YecE (DUF72 family)
MRRKRLRHKLGGSSKQLGDGKDVFAYFNNDAEGHALRNAAELKQYVLA